MTSVPADRPRVPRQRTGAGATGTGDAAGVDRTTRVPALHRPLASYYLVLASTAALLVLGLVMVFSASSVRSYAVTGSSYSMAMKQAIYIALGLPAMWFASRMPIRFWRMLGYPLLLAALFLLVLVLVPGVGLHVDGGTRWIPLPGNFNLQPSEIAKLALLLWGADLLVRKRKLLHDWKHLFVPLLPVTTVICALIMLEPDMGTTLATLSVVVALLWVVGTPARYFGAFIGVLISLATLLAVIEPYRVARLTSFLHPFNDAQGGGYQAVQGLYALSSGGWLGLGLGASREKWAGGLPNAHTDFIFAIIGEELGLLGTLTVLLLFATLTYAGVRVAKRSTDPFARLAASGVTAWLSVQAVINMGAVVGLVPITGIPLPLVSFGGSAMVSTLFAVGLLLSLARLEPGAPQALARRPRLLLGRFLPGPAGGSGPRGRTPSRGPSGTPPRAGPRSGSRAGSRATGRSPARRPAARGR
jgi:cell division protein FtsW